MRTAPSREPAAMPSEPRREEYERIERSYRFISPVFGGGVEVKDAQKPADPITPIRVASVRGQLRFWWRACNPKHCSSVADLSKAEEAVFGSTQKASPLSVQVLAQPEIAKDFEVLDGTFRSVRGREGMAYGAFPLRGSNGGSNGVLHEYKSEWRLAFEFPESIRGEVEAVLWAWAHFGALGGRTRRGFGAIVEVDGPALDLATGWDTYVAGKTVPWPHLPKDRKRWTRIGTPKDNGEKALEFLLGKLRDLRQGANGRKQQGRVPGRSYWPEADSIRAITGQSAEDHKKSETSVNAFPRAAFGLPIIFHFKNERGAQSKEPPDSTLLPEGRGRWASRLILRPHQVGNSKKCEPLALVLQHPDPEQIVLQLQGCDDYPVKTTLSEEEATHIGIGTRPSPLVKNSKTFSDPIERYLEEIS